MFRSRARKLSTPLRCEQLEGREVPATIFALNAGGKLLTFDAADPNTILNKVAISGLATPGEKITDIDVRPGTADLYGRSNVGRLYLINPNDGTTTQLGSGVPTTAANVAMDFDPRTDQLRVVSNKGENLAIDPDDGSLISMDTPLAYVDGDISAGLPPHLAALAFTNSLPRTSTTTLFGIDHSRNTLVAFVDSPQGGQLVTVGSLGIDVTNGVGFDIDSTTNTGFATLHTGGGGTTFAQINLSNGAVFNTTTTSRFITDIAVAPTLVTTQLFSLSPNMTQFLEGLNSRVNSPTQPSLTSPLVSSLLQPLATALTSPLPGSLVQPLPSSLISPLPGSLVQPLASSLTSPLSTTASSFTSPSTFSSFGSSMLNSTPLFSSLTQTLTPNTFSPTVDPFNSGIDSTFGANFDPISSFSSLSAF